jgi:hypothetical protein
MLSLIHNLVFLLLAFKSLAFLLRVKCWVIAYQ